MSEATRSALIELIATLSTEQEVAFANALFDARETAPIVAEMSKVCGEQAYS